jgi:hypothetical protein
MHQVELVRSPQRIRHDCGDAERLISAKGSLALEALSHSFPLNRLHHDELRRAVLTGVVVDDLGYSRIVEQRKGRSQPPPKSIDEARIVRERVRKDSDGHRLPQSGIHGFPEATGAVVRNAVVQPIPLVLSN